MWNKLNPQYCTHMTSQFFLYINLDGFPDNLRDYGEEQRLNPQYCLPMTHQFFLYSHLDGFPDNLRLYGEEQRGRYQQDIQIMEERYQGRCDSQMMADYCCTLVKGFVSEIVISLYPKN